VAVVSKMDDTIFVQIAAYRDPQLVPTLRDCIAKAAQPDRLTFGICWQRAPDDSLEEFASDSRIRVIDIPFTEGRGPCWARYRIQTELYRDEEFTLHLDSHHRFVSGWDVQLKTMLRGLQATGVSKPLITAYLPYFDPQNDPKGRDSSPYRIVFKEYTADGSLLVIPERIDTWRQLTAPVPAKFYSGHFAFTLGQFCRDVPHDPAYYFTGEEMNITVRAWTRGYDLFHPHVVLAYHEYARRDRRKHWDDDAGWIAIDATSKRRNRAFFKLCIGTESHGDVQFQEPFTVGSDRSVESYMAAAGVSYYNRRVYTGTHQLAIPTGSEATTKAKTRFVKWRKA